MGEIITVFGPPALLVQIICTPSDGRAIFLHNVHIVLGGGGTNGKDLFFLFIN